MPEHGDEFADFRAFVRETHDPTSVAGVAPFFRMLEEHDGVKPWVAKATPKQLIMFCRLLEVGCQVYDKIVAEEFPDWNPLINSYGK